jgi:hypothetical protein
MKMPLKQSNLPKSMGNFVISPKKSIKFFYKWRPAGFSIFDEEIERERDRE